MKKKRIDPEDDGRVIANMNVDGMPWYAGSASRDKNQNTEDIKKLSKKETLWLILGVVGAGLLVAAVFGIGFFLFILFADKVWFHN